jgi:hypothetical protein
MKAGATAVNPGQPFEVIPFFCNQLPWFGMAHRVILAFACRTDRAMRRDDGHGDDS